MSYAILVLVLLLAGAYIYKRNKKPKIDPFQKIMKRAENFPTDLLEPTPIKKAKKKSKKKKSKR